MLIISSLKMPLEAPVSRLDMKLRKLLKMPPDEKLKYQIIRRSPDLRRGREACFQYMLYVFSDAEEKIWKRFSEKERSAMGLSRMTEEPHYRMPVVDPAQRESKMNPLVVGFGPAGMFAALLLARLGLKPVVIERGKRVEERSRDVEEFFKSGRLNPDSNVQFGEGGAGTFSDGKLATMVKDREMRSRYILQAMVDAGAPEEILYVNKPHVGTDRLKTVVANLREEIIRLGGSFHFETTVTGLIIRDARLVGVHSTRGDFYGPAVFLGIGHSARDTFWMLYQAGLAMQAKPFAVGLRVEHPQSDINRTQYREYADCPALGAADYKLTYQTSGGRGVYSFCMCPGGYVIAAASEEGGVVTNGMSNFDRAGENANSALLVTVNPDDYRSFSQDASVPEELSGVAFQRSLEQAAFLAGGSCYQAPAQRVEDFEMNRPTLSFGSVKPSYTAGVKPSNLRELLPAFIGDAIAEALPAFDRQLHGFNNPDAVLTGIESRSSSPVRMVRDEATMQSICLPGLYPIGEGAGYAGGIMSAGMDGMKSVEAFVCPLQG